MKALHMVSFLLVIIGALNWGLVGLFNFNLVHMLLGGFENIVYIVVGLAAVVILVTHKNDCKVCGMMNGKK